MKKFLISLAAIALAITGSFAIALPSYADSSSTKKAACEAAYGAGTDDYNKCVSGSTDDAMKKVRDILNVVFAVIGIVAVIMIIYGGIVMMISSGDPGKIKRAKDTIIYSIVGLIIVLLAFAIVNFVVGLF